MVYFCFFEVAEDVNDYSVTNEKHQIAARSFFHWYPRSSNAGNAKEVFQVWLLSNTKKKFKPPLAGEQFVIFFFCFRFRSKKQILCFTDNLDKFDLVVYHCVMHAVFFACILSLPIFCILCLIMDSRYFVKLELDGHGQKVHFNHTKASIFLHGFA